MSNTNQNQFETSAERDMKEMHEEKMNELFNSSNDEAKEYVSHIADSHLRITLQNTYADLLDIRSLSKSWADKYKESKAEIDQLRAEVERLKGELNRFKPDGWWFQHEETGAMHSVADWQVENGFEKHNPRLLKVGRVYFKSEALQEPNK